jgi:hypothetical protein
VAETPTTETPTEAAPNGQPLEVQAPPSHSIIAHQVHGWCSKCPGIELWEELFACDMAPAPSREGERAHG